MSNRNYRLFAAGQVISITGTWAQRVAQDWLVLTLTHSGTAVGITTGLQFLPILLFSLWGGVIADRLPKRQILMATQAAMSALALILGVLVVTGQVQVWHVYALAFGLGLATALDNPTRQSFVTEMVGAADVPNAVALNSATFNVARVIGPAIAGFAIGLAGTGPIFLANAASYIAVLTGLAMMRDHELVISTRAPRARGQLREGVAYVGARPDLWVPLLLVAFVTTLGFNYRVTTALMAKQVFHTGAGSFGLLSTALAVGSLGGALIAARRARPRMRLLLGSAFAFGVLTTVLAFMPTYLLFMLVLVPTGLFTLTFSTAANSTMQLGSSPAMRGRVMALYLLFFTGGKPVGSPLIGWIAQVLNPRYSLAIAGVVAMVAAVIATMVLVRKRGLTLRSALNPAHAKSSHQL
ncbi:MAG: MFS transporter [Sciscionella sp.]